MSIKKNTLSPALGVALTLAFFKVPALAVESAKAVPGPEKYQLPYDVQPLKGKLDKMLMFNSNSPEIVPDNGILLSTLDPKNKRHPEAHLKYAVKGQFAIFFHHINRQEDKSERKLLTASLLAYNPGAEKATITINSLASYVSQPDAPVHQIPPLVDDDNGTVYAGQGDRVVSDYVRGAAVLKEPFTISVAPHSYALVTELPIKVYGPVSTLNGRSYFALAEASKPVQLGLVAAFSDPDKHIEKERALSEMWHPQSAHAEMVANAKHGTAFGAHPGSEPNVKSIGGLVKILEEDGLSGPREGDKKKPTEPKSTDPIVYGRVSGIQTGCTLTANRCLNIMPAAPLAVAFPISTVEKGTMGTGDVQAAPLIKRYPNSAYAAHGNYCVHYQVDLKLNNKDKQMRRVDIALSTPLKYDQGEEGLTFYKEQATAVFFRGVIKVTQSLSDKFDDGTSHYYHLVEHRGERVAPFTQVDIAPDDKKFVRVELYYTPDATPPQVLTVDSALSVALDKPADK
jgi:hypothetical protein